MNVIFTCGGTAGHVNPALALAGFLRERDPKTRILFVGAERGLERDLIAHTPYPFRTVNISSFHRSLRPKELRHNLVSVRNLMHAKREADAILDEFQPDLIVGTGGYASYPVVRYGHARGIPTAVHESNAVPGLTTRLLENHCDRILVGFEDCRRYYKHKDRVVVTGTPVRGDFFTQTKAQAKEKLSVNDGRPLVVSFWGSLGAGNMNRVTAELLYLEAAKEPFHHIHSVGSLGWQKMHEWVSGYGVDLRDHPSLDVREYIYDMADVMRAADLVICRAGASTLSELTALGVPAILVPSPNVTNHHQEKNAALAAKVKELEGNGALAALTAEIDAALADGRLPKSCEAWAKATAKTHPDAVKSYIASSVPPIAALTSTQTGGTPPAGTPHVAALTDEERYACAQLGMTEAEFLEAKKTEKK